MGDISAEHAASKLLACCLAGEPWPEQLVERLIQPDATRALFREVVEPLADRFEPQLCEAYTNFFSEVIAHFIPGLHAPHLVERYERIRRPRKFDRNPASIRNVFVLSRVTLGADVAITSVMLDTAKRVFPQAAIHFVGPHKCWELFAADASIRYLPIAYARGDSLDGRLSCWPDLREALAAPQSIVIDPDSRLTQLGLLPVCVEEDYFFFESRAYAGSSKASLSELAKRWVRETFGVEDAAPYIAPGLPIGPRADITISFGVGENPAKRVADPFEADLLREMAGEEVEILVDRGAGGEEAERVNRAIGGNGRIRAWDGTFAGFAAHIENSRLYIGYDSAGGHVAAACGIPLICVFGGFVYERMFERWRPTGPGPIAVIRAGEPPETLAKVLEAGRTMRQPRLRERQG